MASQHLPLVSVITPSFNQGNFIRETIESVLQQDYPNVEHIVIDGGSTDGTLAILQQYSQLGERFRFVSEPDRGQSHAINKGLAMARGEIIGWLNSDDTYLPGAIRKAVHTLQQHPDWAMVHGKGYIINDRGHVIRPYQVEPVDYKRLYSGCPVCQPTAFIRKQVFQQVGGVEEELQFCMDYDLWIRISKHYHIGLIDDFLANFRLYETSKSGSKWKSVGVPEVLRTVSKHYGSVSNNWLDVFVGLYSNMGIHWILHYFKNSGFFGNTPKVTSMNRFNDLWVPPHFVLSLQIDPSIPMQSLLINGMVPSSAAMGPSQNKLECTVLLDGRCVGKHEITGPSFELEIPVISNNSICRIDLLSSRHFLAADRRVLSFVLNDVIPLSAQESHIYRKYRRTRYTY